MKFLDFLYYCFYQLTTKTTGSYWADVGPATYIAGIFAMHMINVYIVIDYIYGLPSLSSHYLSILIFNIIAAYILVRVYDNEERKRALKGYQKKNKDKFYAIIGALILFGSLLFGATISLLIYLYDRTWG